MFEVESGLMLVLSLALFAVKAFALVDCLTRAPARFAVADTLPKSSWLVILGLTLAAHLVLWSPLSLLNLVGTVAALVYLAQLRGSRG
ncbi:MULTISPECIES: DUF2516 family protein [unclassified Aeromicrobium]|uniref:DUF2516 family protein n=1 Tax=unclassified Aeromicrobium TaxID=2633570 RepID=UPI00288A6882|nr:MULTISPECIES: DUF2516 family protein [unclassified Aeromicrobium]